MSSGVKGSYSEDSAKKMSIIGTWSRKKRPDFTDVIDLEVTDDSDQSQKEKEKDKEKEKESKGKGKKSDKRESDEDKEKEKSKGEKDKSDNNIFLRLRSGVSSGFGKRISKHSTSPTESQSPETCSPSPSPLQSPSSSSPRHPSPFSSPAQSPYQSCSNLPRVDLSSITLSPPSSNVIDITRPRSHSARLTAAEKKALNTVQHHSENGLRVIHKQDSPRGAPARQEEGPTGGGEDKDKDKNKEKEKEKEKNGGERWKNLRMKIKSTPISFLMSKENFLSSIENSGSAASSSASPSTSSSSELNHSQSNQSGNSEDQPVVMTRVQIIGDQLMKEKDKSGSKILRRASWMDQQNPLKSRNIQEKGV